MTTKGRPVATRSIVVALLVALVVIGCDLADATGTPVDRPTDAVPIVEATPRPTADVGAIAHAATFGRWRSAPVRPNADLTAQAELACRSDPLVGDLPLKVLDARGEGLLLLVFARDPAAVLCRAEASEDGSVVTVVRPIAGVGDAEPPGPRTLGIREFEQVEGAASSRTVLVGRVGDDVRSIGVNFDDATWSTASMANGWYATWWPASAKPLGVAAIDNRNVVITSYAP